jgi:periplasmic iron binding protein
VFTERQWPMNSAYMGPHYGNNVTLPGAGRYTLKLLISPPVQGRHLEYAHVWLKQHEVVEHFTWKPTS